MTESTPEPNWNVEYVNRDEQFARLRAWAAEAAVLGRREDYLESLRVIHEKLTTEPLAWGDPQYRAREAGFVLCHGLHLLLHVYYAVHEESRTVWVKEILPLPGQGLSALP